MNKEHVKELLAMVGQASVEVTCYPSNARTIMWQVRGMLQEHLVCLLEIELGSAKEHLAFIQLNAKAVEKKDE